MNAGNSFGVTNPEIRNAGPEQTPLSAPAGFEQFPQQQSPERPLEVGKDTEQSISNQEAQPVFSPPVVPVPAPQVSNPVSPAVQPAPASPPKEFGNTNRIEKSWIDRGNAIIQETRDDPYQQKEKFDELKDAYQAGYNGGGNAAT